MILRCVVLGDRLIATQMANKAIDVLLSKPSNEILFVEKY
jgi:ubiquinone biosynthesis protein Coq4